MEKLLSEPLPQNRLVIFDQAISYKVLSISCFHSTGRMGGAKDYLFSASALPMNFARSSSET